MTGRVEFERALPMWVSAAAAAGNRLLLTGYGDQSLESDGGLIVVSPASGEMVALLQPRKFPDALGAEVRRGGIRVSGTAKTVGIYACGTLGCEVTVVDLASGMSSVPLFAGEGFLRAVTDDQVVITDASGAWTTAITSRTGAVAWTIAGASLMYPVSMGDGSIIADLGLGKSGWTIRAISPSGGVRDLAPVADAFPKVWQQVSTPSIVVFGAVTFEEALQGSTGAVGTVIHVAASQLADGQELVVPVP